VTAIGNSAFQYCHSLNSVTLPEGLVSIGNNAFQNTEISSLTLPSTLKTIGISAFEGNYDITSLVIPEGVEKVGRRAFAYMYGLKKITLPSTLTEIGDQLLYSNGELTEVVSYISEPFEVEDYTFTYSSSWNSQMGQYEYIPSKATLYVPKGKAATYSTTAGWNWFQGIKELTSTVSGDADGDGSVDAADVQMIVNYIMGRNPVGFIFDNANVNGDAEVNAADLVLVIKMMPKE